MLSTVEIAAQSGGWLPVRAGDYIRINRFRPMLTFVADRSPGVDVSDVAFDHPAS